MARISDDHRIAVDREPRFITRVGARRITLTARADGRFVVAIVECGTPLHLERVEGLDNAIDVWLLLVGDEARRNPMGHPRDRAVSM